MKRMNLAASLQKETNAMLVVRDSVAHLLLLLCCRSLLAGIALIIMLNGIDSVLPTIIEHPFFCFFGFCCVLCVLVV